MGQGMGKIRLLAIIQAYGDRTVAITRDTWYGHVVRQHPEMTGRLSEVINAISHPTMVLRTNATGFETWLYQRESILEGRKLYLRACVRWDPRFGTDGFLTTSFLDDKISGGGVRLWPKQ